jgi:apolipoprotein D and lipocalin family protein
MFLKFIKLLMLLSIINFSLLSCSLGTKKEIPPLKVVPSVDLQKYVGTWYEIARFPHRFQEGCVGTTATYTLREDGKIDVLNLCRIDTLDGKMKSASGKAWVVDNKTKAKLKVSFFWPFSGHYWIIDLGDNYEYAVVGHPDRKFLWILSRSPVMDDNIYHSIIDKLKEQFYDTGKLIKTPQVQGFGKT